MSELFRVLVAGAGPGGCTLARDLAKAGISVVVLEKGTYENLGHNWSDALERAGLQEAGFNVPEPGVVNTGPLVKSPDHPNPESAVFEAHAYPEMDVWAPDYSCKKRIQFDYITTDRRVLGKLLADQAMQAGAEFRFNHEVEGPIYTGTSISDLRVTGVRVKDLDTEKKADLSADVTVDDTGYEAVLRTQLPHETGISQAFSDNEFALVYRTVRKRDREKAVVDEIPDHYRYAYNTGYQWAQVLNDDEVDIGCGVKFNADVTQPKDTVEAYIAGHDSITDTVVRGGGGKCLVGISPFSLVAGGFVVVGDAGSQTIPMTGCGAGGAMAGGRMAAAAILAASKSGQTDIGTLWPYNVGWFATSGRGANYAALTALRNILQTLPNAENSYLFRKDIFSAEMLTASINGCFQKPTLGLMLKTLTRCIGRPGLLLKLNRATTIGTKLFKHYLGYPGLWNRDTFERWRRNSEELFARTSL